MRLDCSALKPKQGMGEKEIAIRFEELSRFEVYCSECGSAVVLDMTKRPVLPEQCPCCPKQFSGDAKAALAAYQRFYRAAVDGKLNLQFRVKAP